MNEEVLLCVLPFPEPVDIIKRIREQHPRFKVIYHHKQFSSFKAPITPKDNVPEGELLMP